VVREPRPQDADGARRRKEAGADKKRHERKQRKLGARRSERGRGAKRLDGLTADTDQLAPRDCEHERLERHQRRRLRVGDLHHVLEIGVRAAGELDCFYSGTAALARRCTIRGRILDVAWMLELGLNRHAVASITTKADIRIPPVRAGNEASLVAQIRVPRKPRASVRASAWRLGPPSTASSLAARLCVPHRRMAAGAQFPSAHKGLEPVGRRLHLPGPRSPSPIAATCTPARPARLLGMSDGSDDVASESRALQPASDRCAVHLRILKAPASELDGKVPNRNPGCLPTASAGHSRLGWDHWVRLAKARSHRSSALNPSWFLD
jgi:hypothetical protein